MAQLVGSGLFVYNYKMSPISSLSIGAVGGEDVDTGARGDIRDLDGVVSLLPVPLHRRWWLRPSQEILAPHVTGPVTTTWM